MFDTDALVSFVAAAIVFALTRDVMLAVATPIVAFRLCDD